MADALHGVPRASGDADPPTFTVVMANDTESWDLVKKNSNLDWQ